MEFANFFNEARFNRVKQMLMGHLPTVRTVAIVTAQNPQGQDLTTHQSGRQKNNQYNMDLFNDLKKANFGPIRVQGRYGGNQERSFIVPNIQRQEAVALAARYDQQAVIWGEKDENPDGEPHMMFQWIEDGVTKQTRMISGAHEEIQNRNDYYTMVGNVKFAIPFFDDDAVPADASPKVVKIPEPDPTAYRKAESKLPYLDDFGNHLTD